MTNEQIDAVITKYEEYLSVYGVPMRYPSNGETPDPVDAARHALWMCAEARRFLQGGQREKADRWLGFVQGILWTFGHYSIDDMRGHNTATPPSRG